jgi:hypothetical protein
MQVHSQRSHRSHGLEARVTKDWPADQYQGEMPFGPIRIIMTGMTSTLPQPAIRHSIFVTVLGWIIIVVSALLTPISLFSLLTILVGGDGSSSVTLLGFFSVVVLPPASFVAGIALLRRWTWGWYFVIGLLGFIILMNVWDLMTARETTTTYTSPSGVKNTVMASEPNYHGIPLIVLCSAMIFWLFRRSVRSEFGVFAARGVMTLPPPNPATAYVQPSPLEPPQLPLPAGRDWRVGHQGRDRMYYEELRQGAWQRIDIDGEMLMGRAHHVIYFASPEQWNQYPEWARHRRQEIIGRIKLEFRSPDYEYHEGAVEVAAPSGAREPGLHPPAAGMASRTTASQKRAMLITIVVFLAIFGGMAWLVASGLNSGSTYFPTKRASLQRAVSRDREPALFWFSTSLYSGIGLGAAGMATWFIRQACRKDL